MAALLGGIKGGAALRKVDDSEKRDASTARSAGAVVGAETKKEPEPVSKGVTPASARANISKALGGNKFGGGAPAPAPSTSTVAPAGRLEQGPSFWTVVPEALP